MKNLNVGVIQYVCNLTGKQLSHIKNYNSTLLRSSHTASTLHTISTLEYLIATRKCIVFEQASIPTKPESLLEFHRFLQKYKHIRTFIIISTDLSFSEYAKSLFVIEASALNNIDNYVSKQIVRQHKRRLKEEENAYK